MRSCSFLRFDFGLGADNYTATSCLICLANTFITRTTYTTCGEVGSDNDFRKVGNRHIGIVKQSYTAVDRLGKVVRRHVCGHTHGNTGRAVYKQVGKTCRKYHRFLARVVVIRLKIDCVFVYIAKHFLSQRGRGELRYNALRQGSRRLSSRNYRDRRQECGGATTTGPYGIPCHISTSRREGDIYP